MIALAFILTAIIWGWAHRSEVTVSGAVNHLEKYDAKKPGAGTTVFFVVSVVVGMGLVSLSLWMEWMRSRHARGDRAAKDGGEETAGRYGVEGQRFPLSDRYRLQGRDRRDDEEGMG